MASLLVHETSLALRRPGWQRHLEGWQLAVLAVGMALLSAALSVPRPVRPREVPLPTVNREEEAERQEADRKRLARARAQPLPFLVRAAGEAVRTFGRAEDAGEKATLVLSQEIRDRVAEARRAHGDEPLLALRAAQTALFVDAARSPLRTGAPVPAATPDLKELGGAFARRLSEAPDLAERLTRDELSCLFRFRWSRLADLLSERPFAPSLNEWRLYYRTLLRHPELSGEKKRGRRLRADVATVSALARLDPDYPHELARGVLEYQLGNPAAAAKFFRAHLARHPDGLYRLRAQNYLVQAVSE